MVKLGDKLSRQRKSPELDSLTPKAMDTYQEIDSGRKTPSSLMDKLRSCTAMFPARYCFALMSFLGCICMFAVRVNLSVAIVAMVNSTFVMMHQNESVECKNNIEPEEASDKHSDHREGQFLWDEYTQGIILGAFFWGYTVTQILGGRLSDRFSGKWMFGLGIFITSLCNFCIPFAARAGYEWLVVSRITAGVGEGISLPAMNTLLVRWIPPEERSRVATFVFSGSMLGPALVLPISGLLCYSEATGGWPSVFYVFGSMGMLWFCVWAIFGYDNPEDHPRISEAEKRYITKSALKNSKTKRGSGLPIKSVVTSLPVWAAICAHFGNNWGYYVFMTELPTYFKYIQHFNIKKNGLLSAIPYLGSWSFGMLCGSLSNRLRKRFNWSRTTERKLFNSIGQFCPAICLLLVTITGCNQTLTFLLLVAAMTFNGAAMVGFLNNFLDIAPKFAGTLLGISSTLGAVAGWLAPYIVGILTDGQQTMWQWNQVFYIASSVYIMSATFYVIFSSGDEQPWSGQDNEDMDGLIVDEKTPILKNGVNMEHPCIPNGSSPKP